MCLFVTRCFIYKIPATGSLCTKQTPCVKKAEGANTCFYVFRDPTQGILVTRILCNLCMEWNLVYLFVSRDTTKGVSKWLPAETLRAIREWKDIYRMLKEKDFQSRILYPA